MITVTTITNMGRAAITTTTMATIIIIMNMAKIVIMIMTTDTTNMFTAKAAIIKCLACDTAYFSSCLFGYTVGTTNI